jgi:hypothetical protein
MRAKATDGGEDREGDAYRGQGVDHERQELGQRVVADVEIGEERNAAALGRAEPGHAPQAVQQEEEIAGEQVGKMERVVVAETDAAGGEQRQEDREIGDVASRQRRSCRERVDQRWLLSNSGLGWRHRGGPGRRPARAARGVIPEAANRSGSETRAKSDRIESDFALDSLDFRGRRRFDKPKRRP